MIQKAHNLPMRKNPLYLLRIANFQRPQDQPFRLKRIHLQILTNARLPYVAEAFRPPTFWTSVDALSAELYDGRSITPMALPSGNPTLDTFGRTLRSLRVSVTDRCNLRCRYCMPLEDYTWLSGDRLLSAEEMARLVEVFTAVGARRVRLTGGEPLLRHELPEIVRRLAANPAIEDLALTTNGVLLAAQAQTLREAGLGRVTVSLDTLRADRFAVITRRDELARVLEGIEAAGRAGFAPLKLDAVIMRGVNDDELPDLVEFGKRACAEVRFIEYMDVGGAIEWSPQRVVSRAEMLSALAARYGSVTPLDEGGSAPAERFRLPDGTIFGIIASTTTPFCRACDRSRLTADGIWFLCLYATRGLDLRGPLRDGASPAELAARIAAAWRARDDRGAELRLAQRDRGVFVPLEQLRRDPHLEMHTRGG
jgi:GTP 3',8-cyclase